ncbi:MAG TPA: D-alanyl-D-alanine carboxypeptidase [Steroidobacteraceae bacterium]|nr:D-alanyl-D-alanine carboxypeptidase [Steroidobacteraceae bacterium]
MSGLGMAARSILGASQGVYVEAADGTVLLAQAAARPVHPASVSKIPTTLALLRKFGPDHRFVTTFAASGRLLAGTLYGDLWVESGGDPALVDEDALLVAQRLNALGIRQVTGGLRLQGPLIFDWQSDPDGVRLRGVLSGSTPAAAWAVVRALDASGPGINASTAAEIDASAAPGAGAPTPPAIEFAAATVRPVASIAGDAGLADPGDAVSASGAAAPDHRPLIVYRSQSLLPLLKSLNDYSNNIFKPFADAAGGAAAVQSLARSAVPEAMRSEITLGDGAGTDPRNRLSPRAAVKLLRALDQQLAASGHSLADVLPVAGIDDGTLRNRLNAPGEAGRVAGKTGTYGSYGASALVGAIPTADRGTVYFAILDHDVPVPEARRRQDRFVRALLMHLHSRPWQYQRDARPAVARAQVLTVSR